MIIVKIKNQKNELTWKLVFLLAGGLIISLVIICGIIYSKTVGLKHEISSYEDAIRIGKAKNAELKSSLFKMTDPQIIKSIATEKGLIEDINPQWVFVSSL